MDAGGDWLMVIDLQPAFSHPDSPWFTPTLPDVARRIGALAPAFGERVVFTRFVPPKTPVGAWRDYYERWPFALDPASAWLWEVDAPWVGRPTISGHRFSKWSPEMRAHGSVVVLCGVSTDCCVLMTALAAVDDGMKVRVVADACAAKTEAAHARALAIMAGRAPMLGLVSCAEELALQADGEGKGVR